MSIEPTLARGRPLPPWRLLCATTLALLVQAAAVRACDLCAIYTTVETSENKTGFRIGVAEQFTRFGTLQRGAEKVPNPFDEYLNSSIT